MNRRERRAQARRILSGKGLKGTDKQLAVRELAKVLGHNEQVQAATEAAEQKTRIPGLSRRESGLLVARKQVESL